MCRSDDTPLNVDTTHNRSTPLIDVTHIHSTATESLQPISQTQLAVEHRESGEAVEIENPDRYTGCRNIESGQAVESENLDSHTGCKDRESGYPHKL